MEKGQIRYNPLNGRSVIFAPKRTQRPNDIKKGAPKTTCPFCQENVNKKQILSQVPTRGKWQTAAIKNIFPALSTDNKNAYGYQEIVVDSNKHYEDFADLSLKQIEIILSLFQIRSQKLKKDKKINYILCFKNQGGSAGASLKHIHSQIFASSVLPPDIIDERNRVALYQAENKTCPFCQLSTEEEFSLRNIYADKNMIAFTPFASEFPYEAWIVSRRHTDNICLLRPTEIKSLAKALKLIATGLKNLDYDFNFFTHNDLNNPHQHFYLKIQPRPNIWAGVELGSGLIINPIFPEEAAKHYKK